MMVTWESFVQETNGCCLLLMSVTLLTKAFVNIVISLGEEDQKHRSRSPKKSKKKEKKKKSKRRSSVKGM